MALFSSETMELSNQDKIRHLKRYADLNRRIKRAQDEVDEWRAQLQRMTANYSSQPQGGGSIHDKASARIAKIVDIEKKIDDYIDEHLAIKDGIERAIEAVKNETLYLLLKYRYIDGHTFEEVAVLLDKSWRWTHILHSRALSEIILDTSL